MNNTIVLYLLETAVKMLTDGTLMELAKKLVANMMNEDIPNEEKHANVLKELKQFGFEFGTTVLDIVIKVALLVVRAKLDEAKGGTNAS
jgi:hypothetical protein